MPEFSVPFSRRAPALFSGPKGRKKRKTHVRGRLDQIRSLSACIEDAVTDGILARSNLRVGQTSSQPPCIQKEKRRGKTAPLNSAITQPGCAASRLVGAVLYVDHDLARTWKLGDDAGAITTGLARGVEHPSAAGFGRFLFVGKRKLAALLELDRVIFVPAMFTPIALEDYVGFIFRFFPRYQQPQIGQCLADVQTQLQLVPLAVAAEELEEGWIFFDRMDSDSLPFCEGLDVILFVRLDRRTPIHNRELQVFVGGRFAENSEGADRRCLLGNALGRRHKLSVRSAFAVMQSGAIKKSLSSYTDCSIHSIFMCSLEAVRSLPHEKSSKYFILIERELRDLRYRGATPTRLVPKTLASTLSAVERAVGHSRRAHERFLAGADPASRPPRSTKSATSALQRRLLRIEDLAIKAGGQGPAAEGAEVKLIELAGDQRYARTLALQSRMVRAERWPALILNRLSEAAKLGRSRKAERKDNPVPCRVCI